MHRGEPFGTRPDPESKPLSSLRGTWHKLRMFENAIEKSKCSIVVLFHVSEQHADSRRQRRADITQTMPSPTSP
jgi:hypothetical protein